MNKVALNPDVRFFVHTARSEHDRWLTRAPDDPDGPFTFLYHQCRVEMHPVWRRSQLVASFGRCVHRDWYTGDLDAAVDARDRLDQEP